jgi:hypothetical protein
VALQATSSASRQKASTRAFQSSGTSWNLEPGAGDASGDGSAEAARQDRVEPVEMTSVGAAIRRGGRPCHARAGVRLRLQGLDGLLVGEGQSLPDELVHGAVRVRARGADQVKNAS